MSHSICLEIVPQGGLTAVRISQPSEHIQMVTRSYPNFDLNAQLGKSIWNQFESFLDMSASGEFGLYHNYLIRDEKMTVSLADKPFSLTEFLSQYPAYNPFIQGLVETYNQNYLKYRVNDGVKLLMQVDNPEIRSLYSFDSSNQLHSKSDHGINLLFPEDVMVPAKAIGFTVDFGVICESIYSTGYLLMPRSSIGKTPLRQANSIGLIESTYRGHLMAKVDNVSDQPYQIKKGASLFQLAHANLVNEWSIQLVPICGQTQRGTGGFGSTGK